MKKTIIFVFSVTCIILFANGAYSESEKPFDPKQFFYRAKLYYESGNYDKALSENETILKSEFKSGNLYYNIGNCYLKKDKIGKAILNYERAKYFIPRDSALISNLGYAQSRMKQRDTNVKKPILIKKLNRISDCLTLWESVIVFNIIYYAFTFFVIFLLFVKKFKICLRIIAFLLLLATLSAIAPLQSKIMYAEKGAIVVASIVDAKFEPLEDTMSNFPLYEGMKLYVLKTKKGWHKVKRPDGKIGWVKKGKIEFISL